MTIRRAAAVLVILAGALSLHVRAATPVQKDPPAGDVLRAVNDYLAAYASKVSGVSLDEDYTLLDVTGGRMSETQRLSSDVILLNLSGRILSLRDAYALDANPLRKHEARITALLASPTTGNWAVAQAYAAETARYLKEELVARSDDPMLALVFAAPANHDRVTYRIDGRKKIEGVETIGLRFQETKRADGAYIVTTSGKAAGSGRVWVDPASGRVHRTEFSLQSDLESARVEVTYGRDQALDLWLPKQMIDRYEIREPTGSNTYRTRSYQGRADYAKPRLTPIDLSTMK